MAGGMHHVVDGARQVMGRAGAGAGRRLPHRVRHRQRRHHERAGRSGCRGTDDDPKPAPLPEPTPVSQPFWDGAGPAPNPGAVLALAAALRLLSAHPGARHPGRRPGMARNRRRRNAVHVHRRTPTHRPAVGRRGAAASRRGAVGRRAARSAPSWSTSTPTDIRIGMRVQPVFYDLPDTGITLLRYRPEPDDV